MAPHRFGHRGAPMPAAGDLVSEQRARVLERLRSEFGEQALPFWARAALGIIVLMVATAVLGTAAFAVFG